MGYNDIHTEGFPDSSVGKESASNAGDPVSIPGLGRSPGKGIGNPLQYTYLSKVSGTDRHTHTHTHTHTVQESKRPDLLSLLHALSVGPLAS